MAKNSDPFWTRLQLLLDAHLECLQNFHMYLIVRSILNLFPVSNTITPFLLTLSCQLSFRNVNSFLVSQSHHIDRAEMAYALLQTFCDWTIYQQLPYIFCSNLISYKFRSILPQSSSKLVPKMASTFILLAMWGFLYFSFLQIIQSLLLWDTSHKDMHLIFQIVVI